MSSSIESPNVFSHLIKNWLRESTVEDFSQLKTHPIAKKGMIL